MSDRLETTLIRIRNGATGALAVGILGLALLILVAAIWSVVR